MALIASFFPLISWLLFGPLVSLIERKRYSLSSVMSGQRRRWVANAVHRDTPIDAILASNIMGSVSFFASTTVLIMIGLFTVLGKLDFVLEATNRISLNGPANANEIIVHLACVIVMIIMSFLSFTLALRQYNHFCIMLGAADHTATNDAKEVTAIAVLNTMAARNFNQGIRGYYFGISALGWFWHPWVGIATTLFMFCVLLYREFFSLSRDVVANLLDHHQTKGRL